MNPADAVATLSLLGRQAAILDLMQRSDQDMFLICLYLDIRPGVSKLDTAKAIMGVIEELSL